MKRSIIALGWVLLAGPALAQSAGEKTGVNSALGIAPTTADFVEGFNQVVAEAVLAGSRVEVAGRDRVRGTRRGSASG